MVGVNDNLRLAVDAINAHKLRSVLTVLGLTMGVATLITVMTLVQGANLYVEQKIANLGTNVFRLAKTPFERRHPGLRKKGQSRLLHQDERSGKSASRSRPRREHSSIPALWPFSQTQPKTPASLRC